MSEELCRLCGALLRPYSYSRPENGICEACIAVSPSYIFGTCCSCGYDGEAETECQKRSDKTHCEHWWEGPDKRKPKP